MADSTDFNSWLRDLECPQSCTTDYVKKRLQKGVLGLIWEDLPKKIRPLSEVSEVRRNILLYKLKNEPKDPLIQRVRSTVRLREERKRLDSKIKNAEEQWNQKEYLCRQKAYLLAKKKEERQITELKKDILIVKREQMLMELKNCAKMLEICNNLMPPSVEEVSQSTIIDCLSLVSNYSGGPEKRRVWKQISESLNSIKIPVLWNALLAARSHYTDFLVQLDIGENQENTNTNKPGYKMDTGIAQICSEHINNVAQCHIYTGRMRNNKEKAMEYIEKIEQIIEELRPELDEWLPIALEVRKLEILQNELQKELEKLEEKLPIENFLAQLISEIKILDNKTADCVQDIQNAFGLLKSSEKLITKTKESLLIELERFQLLQTNEKNQWLDIDLSTELIIFQNNLDIRALRKIMLKGETGIYKHLQACYNKASTFIDFQFNSETTSEFPMLRVPIYYLVDLYNTFIVNASLNKRISENIMDIDIDILESPWDSSIDPDAVIAFPHRSLYELLRVTDVTCKKALQHSEEFEQILKTWSNQTVREVVSKIFCNKTVYGATLDEWQKRYSMIVYVLQKSNINA